MKKFLFKSLRFSAFLIIFAAFLFIVYSIIINVLPVKYHPDNGISEIFVGDSHIQCSVVDSLLVGAKNLGESSESFYYSYYKLKLILKADHNIKKVFLGYSYHSLSNYYDAFLKGTYSNATSPDYFYILPMWEQMKLLYWNIRNFPYYLKSLVEGGNEFLLGSRDLSYLGGYMNRFRKAKVSRKFMNQRLDFQFYSEDRLNGFSNINLYYLNKIIQLCRNRNVDLILLSTPLHPYYRSRIPENYLSKYNQIIQENNLKLIDFSRWVMDDSCYVPDGDHVSVKGALKVTQALKKFINDPPEGIMTINQ